MFSVPPGMMNRGETRSSPARRFGAATLFAWEGKTVDNSRFDALARALAPKSTSRRKALRFAALGAIVAAFGGAKEADARCRYEGCGCATGTLHSCHDDLFCCPSAPGTPSGAGTCLSYDVCYPPAPAPCTGPGCVCSIAPYQQSCDFGMVCCPDNFDLGSLTGTCQWECLPPTCTGYGCPCNAGTYLPCDYGLTCVPYDPGLPGSAGTCLPAPAPAQCIDAGCACEYNDPLGCGGGLVCCAVGAGNICVEQAACCRYGGGSCVIHSQCCSGVCLPDGSCAY